MPKKNSKLISCKIDRNIYDELTAYCNITDMSKAMAVERALSLLISEHYKREAIIKKAIEDQK